MNNSLRLLSIS